MPILQSMSLTDRQSTPVVHTFTPRGKPNGVPTLWEDTGLVVGNPLFKISDKETSSKTHRVDLSLAVPAVIEETINGVTRSVVDRTIRFTATVLIPPGSTEAEINNAVGLFQSAFDPSNVLVHNTVVGGESVW